MTRQLKTKAPIWPRLIFLAFILRTNGVGIPPKRLTIHPTIQTISVEHERSISGALMRKTRAHARLSSSMLGGLRARFWRPRASILEGSGDDLSKFSIVLEFVSSKWSLHKQNAKNAKNAKNACQNKTSITNAPRMGGRRWSPPGGFN